MASITTTMKILEASREADVAVWLWGTHGIGKSETVFATAKKLGIGMIDIRAALTEAGDWLGLPVASRDKDNRAVTEYYMSTFLPQDPNWKGFIFLDELNRARPDVLNCVFQLVLNRKIMNHYTLPAGATIVAAGNPADDDYQVTDVDPALLGRFCHISLTPPREEWMEFAKQTKVRSDIIKFISASHPKALDHKMKEFDIGLVTPNRRSWVKLSAMANVLEKFGTLDECLIDVGAGLIGSTFAVQFDQFRRRNFARIEVEKILPDYPSIREQVLKFVEEGSLPEQREALEQLFDKKLLKDKEVANDLPQYTNLLMFLTDIAQDVSYLAANRITKDYPHIMTRILEGLKTKEEYSVKFYNLIQKLDEVEKGSKKK